MEQVREIRQLVGMANNINQIARHLNARGASKLVDELQLLR